MPKTLTWLHLSDLHACKPTTGWDAARVVDTLRIDLEKMQRQHGLRPDILFFTGDLAFGEIGSRPGESLSDQFEAVHKFITAVCKTYTPIIPQRNVFIVPGNHDVNLTKISSLETVSLSQIKSLDDITKIIQENGRHWSILMDRLDEYKYFLRQCGYTHLLTDPDRLIYADTIEINGLKIGVAGFNSAWSSCGTGRDEMGRLWMAGRYQLETILNNMPKNDFKIALIHHPANWLRPEENPLFGQHLERDFTFVLHGHEHNDFVKSNADTGHTVISAGACHEWSESNRNGYNIVRLNFKTGTGEVWMRQYESTGGGWVPRCITNRTTDQGCWQLTHLSSWMSYANNLAATIMPSKKIPDSTLGGKIATSLDNEAPKTLPPQPTMIENLSYQEIKSLWLPKLAKIYNDAQGARSLLIRVGFPEEYIPDFSNGQEFWQKIGIEIQHGRFESFKMLFAGVAADYPYGDFKLWTTGSS